LLKQPGVGPLTDQRSDGETFLASLLGHMTAYKPRGSGDQQNVV
jgi:hypothetical protein